MVDLSSEQIRALKKRFGSLRGAAVWTVQQRLFEEEFFDVGARLIERDGRPPFVDVYKRDYEPLFWKLVWATHTSIPERSKRGAKNLGIPVRELWWIIERRLENGDRASREWLANETKRRAELEYVPRPRLSPLVDWIDGHKERARKALTLREIPREFRAGKLGPIPPSA